MYGCQVLFAILPAKIKNFVTISFMDDNFKWPDKNLGQNGP
jgi:hypothetical protein